KIVDGDDSTTVTNETQALNFTGTITGGTFTISYGASTSAAITYSSTPATLAANIQAALNTLLGAGSTTVSVVTPGQYLVRFGGNLAGANVATLGVASSLTGGGAVSVTALADG